MLTILENGFHFSQPDKKSQLHFSKTYKTHHLALENFAREITGFHLKAGHIGYVGEFQAKYANNKKKRNGDHRRCRRRKREERFRFHFIHHSALSYDLPDPSSYLSKIYKALLRSYASCARQHNTTQHNTAQSINRQWCTRSMHTSTTMKKDKKLNLLLLLVIFYDDEGKSIFSIRNNTNSVTISSPSSSSSSSSPHPTMNVEWIVGQEWACAQ